MKYDAVIFDLDGTLWNATQGIAESWSHVLENQPDIDAVPTVEQLESVMGMTSEALMATLFPKISPERGQELFSLCCADELIYLRAHGGVVYEGVRETLGKLCKQLPLFIVSNCNNGYIECFLEAHQMYPYVRDWECIGRTGRQKADNIKLIVEAHQLKAPVYVGDTILDKNAADQAGVPFIHAGYGFGQVDNVPRISSISQLPECL